MRTKVTFRVLIEIPRLVIWIPVFNRAAERFLEMHGSAGMVLGNGVG